MTQDAYDLAKREICAKPEPVSGVTPEAAASKESAGAPREEIEVTLRMAEAGIAELAIFNPESSSHLDTVEDIFVAIERARRSRSEIKIA